MARFLHQVTGQGGGASMRLRSKLLLSALTGLLLAAPVAASAGSVDIFVGYADTLRTNPNFPSPWAGDAQIQFFNGTPAPPFDAGAIMIVNNTGATIDITDLIVTVGGSTDQIWGSDLGTGEMLANGMAAIFTQTVAFNFDTSDQPFQSGCGINDGIIPTITPTINGVATTFSDTAQV